VSATNPESIRVRVGDVFLVPLGGKWGWHGNLPAQLAGHQSVYGQVVDQSAVPHHGDWIQYLVVLFRSATDSLAEVSQSEIDLAGIVGGNRLRNGEWRVVGNVPTPPLKTPWFAVRHSLLLENFDGSVRRLASAVDASKHRCRAGWDDGLRCAAEAKRGYRPWTPRFDCYRDLVEELTTGEVSPSAHERHERLDGDPVKAENRVPMIDLELSVKAYNFLVIHAVRFVDQLQPLLAKYPPNWWVTEELWERLEEWQMSHPWMSHSDDVLRAHTEWWESTSGESELGPDDRLADNTIVAVRKSPLFPDEPGSPIAWQSVLVTERGLWTWECRDRHLTPSEARECGRTEVRRLRSFQTGSDTLPNSRT
jgi:hypothetical protein